MSSAVRGQDARPGASRRCQRGHPGSFVRSPCPVAPGSPSSPASGLPLCVLVGLDMLDDYGVSTAEPIQRGIAQAIRDYAWDRDDGRLPQGWNRTYGVAFELPLRVMGAAHRMVGANPHRGRPWFRLRHRCQGRRLPCVRPWFSGATAPPRGGTRRALRVLCRVPKGNGPPRAVTRGSERAWPRAFNQEPYAAAPPRSPWSPCVQARKGTAWRGFWLVPPRRPAAARRAPVRAGRPRLTPR